VAARRVISPELLRPFITYMSKPRIELTPIEREGEPWYHDNG
jgi:hypothetical protein